MNVCLCPDAQPRLRLREGIYSLSSHLTVLSNCARPHRLRPHRCRAFAKMWRVHPRQFAKPTSILRFCTVS